MGIGGLLGNAEKVLRTLKYAQIILMKPWAHVPPCLYTVKKIQERMPTTVNG
jgi:hypothetical protein